MINNPMRTGQSEQRNWLDIFKSVAASAFGVQSQKNYHKDFSQTSVIPFVVVGVVFVIAFVLGLVLIVSLIV